MKVSDLIAQEVSKECKHIFNGNGGWITSLLYSFDKVCTLIPVQNEQAASFAADAYSRLTGFGCCIATAGPGVLNLVSGFLSAHYDGVGMLVIAGADTKDKLKCDVGIKQSGFQEMPIKSMFGNLVTVMNMYDKNKVYWQLKEAIDLVKKNKVVILNIPDSIQRAEVIIPTLETLNEEIEKSERPVFIIGQGVKRANIDNYSIMYYLSCMQARFNSKIQLVPTWGVIDMFPDRPRFGQCGSIEGNKIVDSADLIVCFGSRLDSHHVGKDFFKGKKVIYIGQCLEDDTSNAYMVYNCDLKEFFSRTYEKVEVENQEEQCAKLLHDNIKKGFIRYFNSMGT